VTVKEIVRITIEGGKMICVAVDTPRSKGFYRRRFKREGIVQHTELAIVLGRVERAVREALGVEETLQRGKMSKEDRAIIRGVVMATAEFARHETTPASVLGAAGITRELAVAAEVNPFDLEALKEHWLETEGA